MTLFSSTFQKSFPSSPPKEVDSRKYCSKSQQEWQGLQPNRSQSINIPKNGSAAVKTHPAATAHYSKYTTGRILGASFSYTMSNPTPIMLHGCGHTHIQNTGIPALSLAAPQGRCWRGFLGEEERISFKPLKWEPGRKYQISISIYIYILRFVYFSLPRLKHRYWHLEGT